MSTEDGSWIASLDTRGAFDTYLNAQPDFLVVEHVFLLRLAKLIGEATGVGAVRTSRIIAGLS
jgi:hypothetical protein